jgi:integrase
MHVNFVKAKSWIDFSSELEVGETKNAEGRTVYLDDELKQIFALQYEARKKQKKLTPYVFPNKEGDSKIGDFRGAWNAACKKAGIGKRLFQ